MTGVRCVLIQKTLGLATLVAACLGYLTIAQLGAPARGDSANQFEFHHDNILGTSLDLYVSTSNPQAAAELESAVLKEIERLRKILSTYDPESAISRLNQLEGPVPCPAELIDVLRGYELWTPRTQGALNGRLGSLIQTWKEAAKTDAIPDASTLADLVTQIKQTGWTIDSQAGTVTRLTNQALNINSIARGYILDKAAAAGRARVPTVRGFLLDIGGDMVSWGESPTSAGWRIGIADPSASDENAPPIAQLRLANCSVATSGPYQRFLTIAGKKYSHIFDLRTGRPADGIVSSTVVAPDSATANALATAFCVLTPDESLRVVEQLPRVECLVISTDGKQWRSRGFAALEVPLANARPNFQAAPAAQANPWPKDFQVQITLTLANLANTPRYRRPYVAVWLEDDKGKPVRTLAIWGNAPKYQKDLTYWWKFAQNDKNLIMAMTRATRPPGQYQLSWDGKDEKRNLVGQGTYKVVIEVHREHGKHIRQMGDIVCGAEKVSATLEKTAETDEAKITYGPKEK